MAELADTNLLNSEVARTYARMVHAERDRAAADRRKESA